MVSFPRRLQMRRLRRAVLASVSCLLALAAAAALVHTGRPGAAAVLLGVALAYAALCRHLVRLAARSAVGARSEADVRRVLAKLELEGGRMRHSLRWPGGGDIDHVAIAPAHAGVAVTIETKTRTYTSAQLARTAAMAAWLEHGRRSWCRAACWRCCVSRAPEDLRSCRTTCWSSHQIGC